MLYSNILGVEYDFRSLKNKQDLDGYQLYMRNLLNRDFGTHTAPLISTIFHSIGDKHVCEVRVKPGSRPYMLTETSKTGEKQEKLYIRSGNQTVALSLREALDYGAQRWPGTQFPILP